MKKIEIIPAIDIIDGKCVRLTQGDYNLKKVYNENPLEVAKMFESAGL
ncbi:MAG: HisA/HisF-related TIM barrel protein, partial [Prolixibacteraceae bacterium]|nr:HisA/HisF-related TIM barrel protein [Prolixibacteraceae bacterium]